ncbi:SNF2-related protein [Lapillicoccus jejuensis]|uniref:DEAD/DEAH box helicase n=1 Tax=Lapillicoccus jejuensis TaxID=402171 RepID=UPI00114ECB98|nr:SNF2-related protein [Lapillicoccus jejuensis]
MASTVVDLDDEDLRGIAGAATLARGLVYARQGRVVAVSANDDGRRLHGVVHGSGAQDYRTSVWLEEDSGPAGTDLAYWHSDCTCPVGTDCKHAVALVAAARTRLGIDPDRAHEAAPPDWESVLAGLQHEEDTEPEHVPVALQLEPVRLGPRTRVLLRPLALGGRGAWSRTLVTWANVEHDRTNRAGIDPEHRRLLVDVAQAWQRRHRKFYVGSGDKVHLDDLGPGWYGVLRDLLAGGVPLLGGARAELEVRLHDDGGGFVLDVRRNDDGSVRVSPRIAMPDGIAADADAPALVGDPPFGAVSISADGTMDLVRLDPPFDRNQARFLALGSVRIPEQDVDRFLITHAPTLRRQVSMTSGDGSIDFPEARPPRLGLVVTHTPKRLEVVLRWELRYPVGDDVVPVLPDAVGPPGVARDHKAETRLLRGPEVLDEVPGLRISVGGLPRLVPATRLDGLPMLTFLEDVLPQLEVDPDVDVRIEGDRSYTEAEEAPVVELSVSDPRISVPGRTDWFDLTVDVTVGGEKVPLAVLLTALATNAGHVILESGTWFRTDGPELADLRRIVEEARALQEDPTSDGPLKVTPYQADLWEELVQLGVVRQQSERWAQAVAALQGDDGRALPQVPDGLQATLRPYQEEGFTWLALLRRAGLGGILADDMGLGKTVQTLAMVLQARDEQPDAAPVLVVAPTSVLPTWAGEAARFTPGLKVVTLGETTRRRRTPVAEAVEGADLVVTSYAVFRLDAPGFREAGWSALVLDEAQFAKNHRSQVHLAARRLPAPVKFAITGTPMENNLMELWSLLSIVAPGLFPSPQRFTEVYRRPIEQGTAAERGPRLETLRRRIRPVVLRRTKEAVAADLPPKQEQLLEVALSPRHRRVYDTHLSRERQKLLGLLADPDGNRIAIFRSLTLLRQLSLDPGLVDPAYDDVGSAKLDTLLEMLGPLLEEGHRVLVFSQFTSYLARARRRLEEAGIDYAYLDGSTTDRAGVVDGFRSGEAPVFLISLKAGGFGLTLTEADYVVLLDPWWNPAAEAQAVDRVHRIGQDKHVFVYRLVAADTIEQKVVALQERKRELFGQVVDGGALPDGRITADDIRELLTAD